MDEFNPIWVQIVLTVEDLAAVASRETVLSPDSNLGERNREQVRFEIPTFQRGLRWNENKRKQFLSSLVDGLPIGSLVLARNSSTEENGILVKNWVVLDGQQRITSLRILHTSFWKEHRYVVRHLMDDIKRLAVYILGSSDSDSIDTVTNEIQDMLKQVTKSDMSLVDDSKKFLATLCVGAKKKYPNESDEEEDDLLNACTNIRKSLVSQFDALRKYPVPVLLVNPRLNESLEDRQNTLSQVFSALNSYTPLSKYELIAAQWASESTIWPSGVAKHIESYLREQVDDRIRRTYESVSHEFEYDPNFEERDDDSMGLFDVLYALSQSTSFEIKPGKTGKTYIKSDRRALRLPESTRSDVAFEVIGLFLLRKKPTDLAKISKYVPKGELNNLVVKDLIEAYIEASNHLDATLSDIGGGSKYLNTKPIGLIQAIVYLASLMSILRDSAFKMASDKLELANEGEIARQSALKRWKENSRAWWLFDILSDTFQGADANTNAVRRVWGSGSKASLSMCNQPHLQDFAKVFESTFVEESRRLERAPQRRSQSDKARAMMFAAFMHEDLKEAGEADHLIPWRRKSGRAPQLPSPLPLNHVANWMPLEKKINAERGNKSWSDFLTAHPTMPQAQRQKLESRLMLPSAEFTEANTYSVESYLTLMVRRFQCLVDRCLVNVALGEYLSMNEQQRLSWLDKNIREPIIGGLKSEGIELLGDETIIQITNLS